MRKLVTNPLYRAKNIKTFSFFCLLTFSTGYAQVNKEIYREAEVVKNQETIIHSKLKYDLPELKKQLQKGTATIKGSMYARPRNANSGMKGFIGKAEAVNSMIYLIPYTDYVQDYIRLKNSSEKPKKKIFVKLHDEVYDMRIEGMTNNKGQFTFPNLKPGKYYLFGEVRTSHSVKKKYYSNGNIATNAYGQVIAEGYSSYNDYSSRYDYVDNIVEVTNDGQIVMANVSNINKDIHSELKELQK